MDTTRRLAVAMRPRRLGPVAPASPIRVPCTPHLVLPLRLLQTIVTRFCGIVGEKRRMVDGGARGGDREP
jgi:hypothetical protein